MYLRRGGVVHKRVRENTVWCSSESTACGVGEQAVGAHKTLQSTGSCHTSILPFAMPLLPRPFLCSLLNNAFDTQQKIVLIFSIIGTQHFQGYGTMAGKVSPSSIVMS